MSWTFVEERPIYWEEPPEQIAITNVETGEWGFYMLTSAATKRIRELKDEVNWLHVELKEAERACDDCHAISELRELRDEVNWLSAELHGAELEAARAERTCKDVTSEEHTQAFTCSECGCWVAYDEYWETGIYVDVEWQAVHIHPRYCPNCGAKVVEE